MSAASEELADVRGWLCDNLSESDAGKACGMLSVMSRYITELEDENAKLDRRRRSLHADVERLGGIIHRQRKELSTMQYAIECRNDENAKLRELVRDTLTTISWCTIDCCPSDNKKRELNARACELGVEVEDD